jgi:hypothetical protein
VYRKDKYFDIYYKEIKISMKVTIPKLIKYSIADIGNKTFQKTALKIYAALYERSKRKNSEGYFDVPSTYLKSINVIDKSIIYIFDRFLMVESDNSKLLSELFNNLSLTIEDKFDNTQRYILTLNGEADILDKEIKRLQSKKIALNNKAEKLKKMMQNALSVAGLEKFKTPLYNFTIKTTEALEVESIDNIPRNYLRVKYEADKVEIKKAIKDGVLFDGCKIVVNKNLGVK